MRTRGCRSGQEVRQNFASQEISCSNELHLTEASGGSFISKPTMVEARVRPGVVRVRMPERYSLGG
jgi:hypothetical protein